MRSEYNPLVKELAFRALAAFPRRAGRPWRLNCRLAGAASDTPRVVLEAYVEKGGDGDPAGDEPCAKLSVPAVHFRWIAEGIMSRLNLRGAFSFEVGVLAADHPAVVDWRERDRCADFEFSAEEPELLLPPAGLLGEPPGPNRVIDAAPTWLRCIFRGSAFRAYLRAAQAETEQERSWGGCGRVHVSGGSCAVVIEELVGPLPAASAGPNHILTRGRDAARLHQTCGDRLVAYLHLHPRTVGEQSMTPYPSPQDHEVAWNIDRAARSIVVYPIALFRTDPGAPGGDVAVHGYDRGVLCRVQLEVTCDG
jgi:hypothetical protein